MNVPDGSSRNVTVAVAGVLPGLASSTKVAKKLLAAPSARYHVVPVRSIGLPVWPP